MINNLLTINSVDYDDAKNITIKKSISNFNSTSSFVCSLDNVFGKYKDTFSLNEDVLIKADIDTVPPTTKIFRGIIEDIKFAGYETTEKIVLSGRDYGAILQDIIVAPRIFKDTEVSEVVKSVVRQNTTGITVSNVNSTSTTLDKITFNGDSVFDALIKLAELAGFFFYVDEDKDLNFKQKDAISSGETFDNSNVLSASFRQSDDDIFNEVKVVGDRQLTAAQQIFTTGIDNTGSIYALDSKPYNTKVTFSGTPDVIYQPGGIIFINNPSTDDVKYLVDFPSSEIVLTSGTAAGDNVLPAGSILIVDYDQSTPLISTRRDNTSITNYGLKNKEIIDKNIKSLNEANDIGSTFLVLNKDPKTEGTLNVKGVVNVTPGETALIDLPNQNQSGATYTMTRAKYDFNDKNNLNESALNLSVSQKIDSFVDLFTQHELRLRSLETSEVESSITNLELYTGSIGVSGAVEIISKSIGSTFYFNVTGHDILESPSSLLGDMRTGSTVVNL